MPPPDYPHVEIKTSAGRFVVEVFLHEAPDAAGHFLKLAEKNGFVAAPFYRIVPSFIVQAGFHLPDNGAGPRFGEDEPIPSFYRRGVLATVAPGPSKRSEDFFICLHDLGWLPNRHTIFAQVVEGFEVVEMIGKIPFDDFSLAPLDPPVIQLTQVLDEAGPR